MTWKILFRSFKNIFEIMVLVVSSYKLPFPIALFHVLFLCPFFPLPNPLKCNLWRPVGPNVSVYVCTVCCYLSLFVQLTKLFLKRKLCKYFLQNTSLRRDEFYRMFLNKNICIFKAFIIKRKLVDRILMEKHFRANRCILSMLFKHSQSI